MRIFLSILLSAAALLPVAHLAGQSLSGRRAPSFSLPDTNQVQHDILDYRGKWLVMTYTTSITPNCSKCAPLARAMEPLQSAKVSLLWVMISPPENANTAGRFAAENKIIAPIVFDQSQTAIAYFKASPQNSRIDTPHVFIINPSGMLVQDWPSGVVGQILESKGGVAAALQQVIASSK